tara:strand:+ start:505 stop:771 length:267 start_codon:yes stop_codon:yes gene_type:complete
MMMISYSPLFVALFINSKASPYIDSMLVPSVLKPKCSFATLSIFSLISIVVIFFIFDPIWLFKNIGIIPAPVPKLRMESSFFSAMLLA